MVALALLGAVLAKETCDPFESFALHPATKGVATHGPRPSQHQVRDTSFAVLRSTGLLQCSPCWLGRGRRLGSGGLPAPRGGWLPMARLRGQHVGGEACWGLRASVEACYPCVAGRHHLGLGPRPLDGNDDHVVQVPDRRCIDARAGRAALSARHVLDARVCMRRVPRRLHDGGLQLQRGRGGRDVLARRGGGPARAGCGSAGAVRRRGVPGG